MNLLFDFTVDKENLTLTVTREFAADLNLVWDAWTKSDILDQWWSPKPWKLETKEMDFREGGRWLYAMVSPDGTKGWSLQEFIKIEPKNRFVTKNSFCDENGNRAATGFTFSITTNTFKENGDKTTVQIIKKMESLEQLEKFAATGYTEGMKIMMSGLDELLAKHNSRN